MAKKFFRREKPSKHFYGITEAVKDLEAAGTKRNLSAVAGKHGKITYFNHKR